MEYCPRCMLETIGPVCTHCGTNLGFQNESFQLPVGTVLVGGSSGHSYRIGAALGQGGFGITYIALENETGRRVAVKEFFPTRVGWVQRDSDHVTVQIRAGKEADYTKGRMSFLKEARILASMNDSPPSVVKGLDYAELHNTAYLIMEFLDGTPLYRMVEKRGKIPADELLPRLQPLMNDLAWLHKQNIIHRDIGPDNIMWMPDGALKLLDFGSARRADGNNQLTVLLKPKFAPVEQYQTDGQGPWTDVYTLAASIYYCLTGVIPTNSVDRLTQIRDAGIDPLKPPTALGAALTAAQESVLLHALTVEPGLRLRSMDEFTTQLFPAAKAQPEAAPFMQEIPMTSLSQPSQQQTDSSAVSGNMQNSESGFLGWMKRNWYVPAVVAAMVVALIIFILLM